MRAWHLVMLVSACGSNAAVDVDAGLDAGSGAPYVGPVDPMCPTLGAPGDVTVELPAAADSVTIIISDNTGAMLSRVDGVATSGPATVSVPACGMLTVVRSTGSVRDAFTWTGVQPGDHLVDPRSVATMTISPSLRAPSASGEADYNVAIGCVGGAASQAGTSSPATLAAGSIRCPASDSIVEATLDVTDGSDPTEYAVASAPISGGAAALTFGPVAPAPAQIHVDVSGASAFVVIKVATDLVSQPGLDVPYAWRSGNVFNVDDVSLDIDAGPGAGTLVITTDSADFGQDTVNTVVRPYDAWPASVALDSSELLPPLTYTTSYEAGRIAVGLSTPTPTSGSLAIATIEIFSPTGAPLSTVSTWRIAAPANTPALYLPALPADLGSALDESDSSVSAIDVYDDPDLPTYAIARAHLDELPAGTPTTAMHVAHTWTNATLP